jgi:tetratricopeptide (TPR) repeat protein
MKIDLLLKKISLWSVLGTAFLSIILVIPVTDSFVDQTKSYLLFLSSILVILFFALKTLREKAAKITVSPISGSLLFFGLAAVASTFFTSNYPVESLLGMGGVYIATTIIALLGGSLIKKNSISKLISGLTISSLVLVVLTILQMVGFGPAQLINKLVSSNLTTSIVFNLAGSPFIALQIILVTIVGIISTIVSNRKVSKFFIISLPVLLIGAVLFSWSLLPGKETSLVLPPLNTSWSIMLDVIKNPKSALIGAGPNAYSNIYTTFKPMWINNTSNWSTVFSQAANFPLTLLSTMGIIGLATWIFFVVKFIKLGKISLASSKPVVHMIAISLLFQFLLPINTVSLTIQAVALACLIANEKHRLPLLQLKNLKSVDSLLNTFAGLGLIGAITMLYLLGRSYNSSVLMAQSSKAFAENNLVKVYELQQKAVSLNQYLDVNRRRYASTNALIAIALSNKADITQEEKSQVSLLLQQSVREAKAATDLDPIESQNWVNLAQVYKNMIGVSDDAAQWAVQSYIAAIKADPNNPLLRIELAKIFVDQENYQQAISILSQAISLKPNLAASHYNLALILEKLDQPNAYREARISYQRTLVLLDSSSEEYILVNKKIEEIEFTMKEKGISIELEQQEQALDKSTENKEQDPAADKNEVPSITEQNLDTEDESKEDLVLDKGVETKLSEEL